MTDFRALCAEMANELDNYYIGIQGHDRSHPLAVEARAALAQSEPQGPGPDDVTQLYYKHGGGDGFYGGMSEVEFEYAVEEALARWGRPAP